MSLALLGQHLGEAGEARGARARASGHRRRAGPGPRSPPVPSLSVSETTPHGALHQARMRGRVLALARPAPVRSIRRRCRRSAPGRRRARAICGSRAPPAALPPAAAMISSAIPVSSRTRSMNSRPLTARRQASVATERDKRHVAAAQLVGADRRARRPRGPSPPRSARPLTPKPFAEPDDARESVDDGEAAARSGGRSAAGNCWCRGRPRHRCGADASAALRTPCRRLPRPRRSGEARRRCGG